MTEYQIRDEDTYMQTNTYHPIQSTNPIEALLHTTPY